MSNEIKHQEHWRDYVWLLERLGKGRKRYLLIGSMFIVMILLLVLPAVMFSEFSATIVKIVVAMGLAGLFLNLITSLRLRYWHDILFWGFSVFIPAIMMLFVAGFMHILNDGQVFTLVFMSVLLSFFIIFRRSHRELERWELARQKGLLECCLDEENWTYDDDPAKSGIIWFALSRAGKTAVEQRNSLKWLKRLEKLHYLIPGIMISFRRAFGHEEIVIGVLLITLGLVFTSVLPGSLGTYLKIREWEREKGKPILLRWAWEKEHGKR